MKHKKSVKLEGPLKEKCLYIIITLDLFESKVLCTLQLLLGIPLKA